MECLSSWTQSQSPCFGARNGDSDCLFFMSRALDWRKWPLVFSASLSQHGASTSETFGSWYSQSAMPAVRLPLFQHGLGAGKEASNLSTAARNLVSAIWSWRFEKFWQPASRGEVLYSLTRSRGEKEPCWFGHIYPDWIFCHCPWDGMVLGGEGLVNGPGTRGSSFLYRDIVNFLE